MPSGLFAILDDVATLMDDVAMMSKVAGKKTAGLIGDDLAVNAEKASGFVSARELPVLWAITKGSFINKLIILPVAFFLSAYIPIAVIVILIMGGIYLAYEGAHKVYEYVFPHSQKKDPPKIENISKKEVLAREKGKIKSAIITDFILSVEIVIIALSSVSQSPLLTQIIVVSVIAFVATVGVYGIVAIIVRMDEFGTRLINMNKEENSFSDKAGRSLVWALPKVIKSLSFIGTIALILVSGGIFAHNIAFLHGVLENLPTLIVEFGIGLISGFLILSVARVGMKLWKHISG